MPQSTMEERIAALEGSYREITKRIDDLRSETHRGFDALGAKMNDQRTELKAEIAELRAESRANFRWLMGMLLVNWLSLMAAIFLVARR